jgi:phage major head subunit gpT-like protein
MLITQPNLRAMFQGYNMLFQRAYDAAPTFYKQLATVVASESKQNVYPWLAQLPGMREWIGERVVNNVGTHSYTIVNKTYEGTEAVSLDDIKDDSYGLYGPMMEMMGQAAAQLPDELIAELLLDGETNLCFDGQPYFDIDHPIDPNDTASGVYSNLFASTPLTAANFAAVRATMLSRKGNNGKPLRVRPNLLLVPPALERTAKEILNASIIANTSNVLAGMADVIVLEHLASRDGEWYLADTTKPVRGLIYQVREATKFVAMTNANDEGVFTNREFRYGVDGRSAAGYSLPFLMAKARA